MPEALPKLRQHPETYFARHSKPVRVAFLGLVIAFLGVIVAVVGMILHYRRTHLLGMCVLLVGWGIGMVGMSERLRDRGLKYPYIWTGVLIAGIAGGILLAPPWTVLSVGSAAFGASIGHALWEDLRTNAAMLWARLLGGFVLVGLNLAGLIIVGQNYNFRVAHLLLQIALYAGTFVAGLMFGSALSSVAARL